MEDVRVAVLAALSEQYQRMSFGRPIPKLLEIPRPRIRVRQSQIQPSLAEEDEEDEEDISERLVIPKKIEDDISGEVRDDALTPGSDDDVISHFQDEPPSPPLTPKAFSESPSLSEDTQPSSVSSSPPPHPTKSVFAAFCPDAMTLQVDIKKPLPDDKPVCSCGYRWKALGVAELETGSESVRLKEGFQLTQRFLAKSHLGGPDGYGCTLCTSTGRTEQYRDIRGLQTHINLAHTKWQLLHDPDLGASSSRGAVLGF